MAITVYGVPTSIDALHWAMLMQDLGDSVGGMGVPSGLLGTEASGTRVVAIHSGRSLQAGTLAVSDAATNVTLAANTATTSRIDLVCMQVDWSGTTTTAGSLVVVSGTAASNPVAPTLTQSAGVKWQTPLLQVLVRAGVGQILGSDVTDVRPGAALTSAAVTIPGNFTADSFDPLTVTRTGGIVEFSGRVTRNTTTVQVGSSAINGSVIIPDGYRPTSQVNLVCHSDVLAGSPKYHTMTIDPSGAATLYPGTGAIGATSSIRVSTTHWIGA